MTPLAKAAQLALILAALAPGVGSAQTHHAGHGGTPESIAKRDAALAEGTVKKVDKVAGRLTIAHGPLTTLAMPAMTMAFRPADPAMLDQVKAGDRIHFAAAQVKGILTVTAIQAAP